MSVVILPSASRPTCAASWPGAEHARHVLSARGRVTHHQPQPRRLMDKGQHAPARLALRVCSTPNMTSAILPSRSRSAFTWRSFSSCRARYLCRCRLDSSRARFEAIAQVEVPNLLGACTHSHTHWVVRRCHTSLGCGSTASARDAVAARNCTRNRGPASPLARPSRPHPASPQRTGVNIHCMA